MVEKNIIVLLDFLREIPEELLEENRGRIHITEPTRSFQSTTECGYQIGQRVHHTKFGEGIILAIAGEGANTRVQVKFQEGAKWLVIAYANLHTEMT